MGLRGMRVRKSPLVRVLYAEATRPFPVNAKGAGPQTMHAVGWVKWTLQLASLASSLACLHTTKLPRKLARGGETLPRR